MQNFDEQRKINRSIEQAQLRTAQPGYGIVMEFNEEENTATVLMAYPGSDMPGEFYKNVPCPTSSGIQTVAPEVGRPCWIAFKDGLQSSPVITHFFHHSFGDMEYDKQYTAENNVPRFMLEL